jgi:hypothetical protein
MKRLSRIATVAIFMCLPAGAVLAQSAPAGTDQQAPAAAPAPPAAPAPAAPAPAASPAPASPAPAASPTTTENKPTTTRKKRASGTSRKEIDKSIQSGTVPSRYRSQVPKEYQQYIPFEK